MIYRSRAPLRIGLAGGGTDVSPYSEEFGGAILNASISLYAYASIEEIQGNEIILHAIDRDETQSYPVSQPMPYTGELDLLKSVFNRMPAWILGFSY